MNEAHLQRAVEGIVRQAGKLLLTYRQKKLTRVEKINAGFVTEADTGTEAFLLEQLAKVEPGISFFAEENGHSKNGSDTSCWVIDPLDGTTNFAYGIPHYCISVALTQDDQPVLGFVYNPLLDEMFVAHKGKGAYLNGQRLKVSQVGSLEESVLLFCIPYAKNPDAKKLLKKVIDLGQQAYSIRLFGAAALDQAYTAAGRFDGMFFEQLSWWDIAAGSLIIQEAGGAVSEYNGNSLTPHFKTFVGGNPKIHELLVTILSGS